MIKKKENKIEKKVFLILKKILKLKKKVKPKKLNQKNIKEWDSLNHITLLMALQEELKIEFNISEQPKLTSYKNILKFVLKKVN